MQHELLRVLYPVFIHCFMDLVAKGHVQEGMSLDSCLCAMFLIVKATIAYVFT